MDNSEKKNNRTKTTGPEETRFVFISMPNILFCVCVSSNLLISVLLLVGFLGF